MMKIYLGDDADELDGFEFLDDDRGRRARPLGDRARDEREGRRRRRARAGRVGDPDPEASQGRRARVLAGAGRRGGRMREVCALEGRLALRARATSRSSSARRARRPARTARTRATASAQKPAAATPWPGAARVARARAAEDHEREQRADPDAGERARPRRPARAGCPSTAKTAHQPSAVSVRPATSRRAERPRARRAATAETTIGPTPSTPSSATIAYVSPPTSAEAGSVSTHAMTMLPATPQRTAETRLAAPCP